LDIDRTYLRLHISTVHIAWIGEEPALGRGWEIRNMMDGRTTQSTCIMEGDKIYTDMVTD
jgi:hypothetical protein